MYVFMASIRPVKGSAVSNDSFLLLSMGVYEVVYLRSSIDIIKHFY